MTFAFTFWNGQADDSPLAPNAHPTTTMACLQLLGVRQNCGSGSRNRTDAPEDMSLGGLPNLPAIQRTVILSPANHRVAVVAALRPTLQYAPRLPSDRPSPRPKLAAAEALPETGWGVN